MRQLIKFVRSAKAADTDLANLQPEIYKSPARLHQLENRVHLEADNTVRDIEIFLQRCRSRGNNPVALSASYLLLTLESSRDRNDKIQETVPFHSVPIENSQRLGDWGAALMMQETILVRTTRNRNLDTVASEIQSYLKIHREFSKRMTELEMPVIPPLHFLLLLTNDGWILEAAAVSLSLPQDEDPLGRSLLQMAMDEIPSLDIQLLLEWGPSPLQARDVFGRSVLHAACMNELTDAVQDLLRYGAAVTAIGPMGWQPLHFAVAKGSESIAKLLLANGADPNCEDDLGMTPLSYAARDNRWQMIRLLLAQKNIKANNMDQAGMTPLLYAAHNDNERLVRLLLLRNDVDPEYSEKNLSSCKSFRSGYVRTLGSGQTSACQQEQ